MAKNFFETIIASGGFAGESFDMAVGPANTDVIDLLLSAAGAGPTGVATLQENAPVNLYSTGALGAAKNLSLSGIEQNGRFFFLSVRNSDISTNNLTVTATTDINGGGTDLVISVAADYIFVHETGGSWRAYQQRLSTASAAAVFRATFAGTDWTNGTANEITIIQTGAPAAGEIGPHALDIASSYDVTVLNDTDDEVVDVGVSVNTGTGDITLSKTGLGPNFAGRVLILGTVA
jgi:hypothetical protein